MGNYIIVVQSRAKDGRDAEYNAWYDNVHLADLLDIPAVESGRRYVATPVGVGEPGLPYLSIYEVRTDDPAAVMAELGARSMDGRLRHSDALDRTVMPLWFYEAYEPNG